MLGTTRSKAARLAVTATAGLAITVTGAGLAEAAPSAATTTVNIRSGPGTSHKVVGSLVKGQRISTAGKAGHGWVRVELGSTKAYMAAKYLRAGKARPSAPSRIKTSGAKIATARLNVRSGPAKSRSIVGHIAEGKRLKLTGKLTHGYAQTRYRGKLRWVSVGYLASTSGGAKASPARKSSATSSKGRTALAFAKRQLGKPYRYGAAGPSSYDCSGLTSSAWRSAGVRLPRTARQQYSQGRRIAKSQLRPGDLVFFYGQSPSHVALYVGSGKILHSPRPGRSVEYTKMSYMPYAGAVRPG